MWRIIKNKGDKTLHSFLIGFWSRRLSKRRSVPRRGIGGNGIGKSADCDGNSEKVKLLSPFTLIYSADRINRSTKTAKAFFCYYCTLPITALLISFSFLKYLSDSFRFDIRTAEPVKFWKKCRLAIVNYLSICLKNTFSVKFQITSKENHKLYHKFAIVPPVLLIKKFKTESGQSTER